VAATYRVLDVHHHIGDASQALAMPPMGKPPEEQPPKEKSAAPEDSMENDMRVRVETMDRSGVDAAIVIPAHNYLRPEGLADTRRTNDGIAAYRDTMPARFAGALGIVEPLYGPAGNAELRRVKEQLGFVGISIHTRFQGVSTDSPLVMKQLSLMGELGLVPFVHSVAEETGEALWRVHNVARAFPDVTMVVLDTFSSHEQASHAMTLAELAPNLIFDTSLAYTVQPALRLMERFGHHRVIFGTDLYSPPLGYKRSTVLDQLLDAGLPEDVLQDVLAGTAERLLGLDPVAQAAL
jgi:predicted TIM-barrel fold metal-dependent hydrolase